MNYNLYLMGAPMKSDFKNLKKIFEQANEQLLNLDMNHKYLNKQFVEHWL